MAPHSDNFVTMPPAYSPILPPPRHVSTLPILFYARSTIVLRNTIPVMTAPAMEAMRVTTHLDLVVCFTVYHIATVKHAACTTDGNSTTRRKIVSRSCSSPWVNAIVHTMLPRSCGHQTNIANNCPKAVASVSTATTPHIALLPSLRDTLYIVLVAYTCHMTHFVVGLFSKNRLTSCADLMAHASEQVFRHSDLYQ